MKQIELTQGKFVLVDDEDFNHLNSFKWCYSGSTGYAVRRSKGGRKNSKIILMHRELLNFPDLEVDHIDRNKLNNQKYNLRIATRSQNSINKDLMKNNTSGYKGIHWDKERKKWFVQICRNNIHKALGRFDSLEEAILIRKKAEENYNDK